MGKYKVKVTRSGFITVEADSLDEAMEYVETCNPIDDISWSDFVSAVCAESGEKIEEG